MTHEYSQQNEVITNEPKKFTWHLAIMYKINVWITHEINTTQISNESGSYEAPRDFNEKVTSVTY